MRFFESFKPVLLSSLVMALEESVKALPQANTEMLGDSASQTIGQIVAGVIMLGVIVSCAVACASGCKETSYDEDEERARIDREQRLAEDYRNGAP